MIACGTDLTALCCAVLGVQRGEEEDTGGNGEVKDFQRWNDLEHEVPQHNLHSQQIRRQLRHLRKTAQHTLTVPVQKVKVG